VRSVELAIYADALAGEAASLAARAERARSRLRQAAIEKRARSELSQAAIERLEARGLVGGIDEQATRAELRELESVLEALEELQAWIEGELAVLARRDRHEQPAVVVVGREEVGRHGLRAPDARA